MTARLDWPPIIRRAAEIVEERETPVTLRQAHYLLVSEGWIPNTESAYKRLSRLSAEARREGTFPPLSDPTRAIESVATFGSARQALDAIVRIYRGDLLAGHETVPMILVEKATLVAQMRHAFDDLRVPVAALRGYASQTFEREIAERVEQIEDGGRRHVVILYVGDWDGSGENIPEVFERHTGLKLRPVALTRDQVREHRLPLKPGKDTDSRARGFAARHGENVQVEIEALPPETLRDLVAAEIDALIDPRLVEAEREREREERAALVHLRETLR